MFDLLQQGMLLSQENERIQMDYQTFVLVFGKDPSPIVRRAIRRLGVALTYRQEIARKLDDVRQTLGNALILGSEREVSLLDYGGPRLSAALTPKSSRKNRIVKRRSPPPLDLQSVDKDSDSLSWEKRETLQPFCDLFASGGTSLRPKGGSSIEKPVENQQTLYEKLGSLKVSPDLDAVPPHNPPMRVIFPEKQNRSGASGSNGSEPRATNSVFCFSEYNKYLVIAEPNLGGSSQKQENVSPIYSDFSEPKHSSFEDSRLDF